MYGTGSASKIVDAAASSRFVRPLAFLASFSVGGCDIVTPGSRACTLQAVPAVSVEVLDSARNVPVGRGAQIIARDGAFADTVSFTAYDGPYGLAPERAGTYTVTVQQQGYLLWSVSGIRVSRDECHVRTATLRARLQPSSG